MKFSPMDRIAVLSGFIEKNPLDMFSRHALALEYIKLGEISKAINTFEELLTVNPEYVGSYYHLGKCYTQQGDSHKALQVYASGIQIASKVNDQHARRELMSAHDLLLDEMED